MSTFTEWNGPESSNVRANDLLALTQAYQNMLNSLNTHIANKPQDNDVHSVKTFVEDLLDDYVKLAQLNNTLNLYYTKNDADTMFATKAEIPVITGKADKTELNTKADKIELNAYIKKDELNTTAVIANLLAEVNKLNTLLKDLVRIDKSLYWQGLIDITSVTAKNIKSLITTLDYSTIKAYIGGSDNVGAYYILGMITGPGTAFIKYNNQKTFTAVVNFTAAIHDDIPQASLSVVCDNIDISELKFKIVEGSDINGDKHLYFAVQSKDWMPQYAVVDGKGLFNSIDFFITGLNIYPVGTNEFIQNNTECVDVVECISGNGFSTSALSIDTFKSSDNKQMFKIERDGKLIHLIIADSTFSDILAKARPYLLKQDGSKSPFLTVADITSLSAIGTMSMWPKWKDVGNKKVADDISDIDLPCDGEPFDEKVYSELYDLLGDNHTPIADYMVIRAKSAINIINDLNADGGSLADAVATIHETKIYTSTRDLPDQVPENTLAIVKTNESYFVYIKTANGWEIKT